VTATLPLPPVDPPPVRHTLPVQSVLWAERVEQQRGLDAAEVRARTERFGANVFAAAEVEPRWRAFVRQYKDLMQVVLLVAGVGRRYAVEGRGDQEGDPQVVGECAVP
jgi:Ca2+-transporting ATPase